MRHRKPSFKGIGRLSGATIGAMAVKIYECNGCHAQHKAEKATRPGQKNQRPTQCLACGRMDFTTIDSQTEANRLGELRLLQHAGIIDNLRFQVRFPLMAARADGTAVKVGEYIADFTYDRDGSQVIEDAKPDKVMTDLAQWKLRHMAAQGMPVTIVTPRGKR